MAKTAKIKKKQVTFNSRASRRAVSPTDPSVTKLTTQTTTSSGSPPPDPASTRPHVLAAKNAGISKSKSSKPLKRAQRLRQQKGMERAEHNMDKLELKREKSFGREKKVKERAKGWEEVNETGLSKQKSKGSKADALLELADELAAQKRAQRKWELGEEMGADAGGDGDVPSEVAEEMEQTDVVVPQSVPLPAVEDDEAL